MRVSADDYGRGVEAFRRFREATAELVEVTTPVAQEDFHVAAATYALDGALLVDARTNAAQYDRTPRHIALGSMDHYDVALCLAGQVEFTSGRRSAIMRPGDLCFIDTAQANRTSLAPGGEGVSRVLTLVLPRAALAPLLAAPDATTASLVPRDSVPGRSLADHFLALHRDASAPAPSASAVAADALAGLVADAVGPAHAAEEIITRANHASLMASIKRHIDANLQTTMIGVDHLCHRFQLSRATLYRMFEPDGGLWRYIQDQRLNRAFQRLAMPLDQGPRVIDLAVEFQFSSDSTFVRAFRRRFGVTPGEVRQLAQAGAARRAADASQISSSLVWIRSLGQI